MSNEQLAISNVQLAMCNDSQPRKMKYSGVEWIGDIPEDWETIKFSSFIDRMGTGLNPRDNFVLDKDSPYYYVTIRNFKNGKLFLDDKCDRIDQTAFDKIQERSQLQIGDFLFASISKDAQVYYVSETPSNWNINESVFCIRPKRNIFLSEYLYYHLIDYRFYESLLTDATGSTFLSIKQNKLRQSFFVLPPLSEQQAIADILDRKCTQIDALIANEEQQIAKLKAYKQSVITETVTKGLNPDVPMKDSGVEWIGRISTKHSIKKLKFLLSGSLMYGANESGEPYDESLPRYIRITDIAIDGSLKTTGRLSLSDDIATPYLLKDGDILFARSGATVGKAFIFKSEYR